MSKVREQIKASAFGRALLLQLLGMACHQYESAYFPEPYADNQPLRSEAESCL